MKLKLYVAALFASSVLFAQSGINNPLVIKQAGTTLGSANGINLISPLTVTVNSGIANLGVSASAGLGTVTTFSASGPSLFTFNVATPTTTPALTVGLATGQTANQVLATNSSGNWGAMTLTPAQMSAIFGTISDTQCAQYSAATGKLNGITCSGAGPGDTSTIQTNGLGTTALTLNQLLGVRRDIRNYGATPNNATFDNEPAIASAISDVSALGGGTVFIPCGTWYTSSSIVLSVSSVHVVGCGWGDTGSVGTQIVPTASFSATVHTGAPGTFLAILDGSTDMYDARFSDITFNSNDSTVGGGYVNHANEMSGFDHVAFAKVKTYGYYINGAGNGSGVAQGNGPDQDIIISSDTGATTSTVPLQINDELSYRGIRNLTIASCSPGFGSCSATGTDQPAWAGLITGNALDIRDVHIEGPAGGLQLGSLSAAQAITNSTFSQIDLSRSTSGHSYTVQIVNSSSSGNDFSGISGGSNASYDDQSWISNSVEYTYNNVDHVSQHGSGTTFGPQGIQMNGNISTLGSGTFQSSDPQIILTYNGGGFPNLHLGVASDGHIDFNEATSGAAFAFNGPLTTNGNTIPWMTGALTAGDCVKINSTTGALQDAGAACGSGSGGGVSSVGLSMPAEFSVSGSPVTSAGVLTVSKANQSANQIYAGPATGSPAVPTFRSLAPADLPVATTSALGVVKPDGSTITISGGVISATGSGSGGTILANPVASVASNTLSIAAGSYGTNTSFWSMSTASCTPITFSISSVSNTSPIVVTLTTNIGAYVHSGDTLMITGVGTGVNGTWVVTVDNPATSVTLNGSTAAGAFGAGGTLGGTGSGSALVEGNDAGQFAVYVPAASGVELNCTNAFFNQQATPTYDADAFPLGVMSIVGGAISGITRQDANRAYSVTAGDGILIPASPSTYAVQVDSTVARTTEGNVFSNTNSFNSQVLFDPTGSAPTCNSSNQGTLWYTAGSSSTDGGFTVCNNNHNTYQYEALGGGSSITLQTGGTNNSSQSLLNLVGSGPITATNTSGGTVQIAEAAINAASAKAFWIPGVGHQLAIAGDLSSGSTGHLSNSIANKILGWAVTLEVPFTINQASINVTTADSGATGDLAIYDPTGATMLWHYGSGAGFSLTSTGVATATNTAVTLQPGTYIFATTESGTVGVVTAYAGFGTNIQTLLEAHAARVLLPTGTATSGILPSSLGTLTGTTSSLSVPAVVLE